MFALAVSPDGWWAVAGLKSGRVYALDLADPAAPARSLGHLPDRVCGVGFSPDGRAVYAGAEVGAAVTRWAAGTWACDRTV